MAEEKTYNYNCKKICCEMQKNALRLAVKELKNSYENIYRVKSILASLVNILKVYECSPYKCLLKRIQWVASNIDHELFSNVVLSCDRVRIDILVAEIEAFLDSEQPKA